MLSFPFSTSATELVPLMGSPHWPQVIDVRLDDDFQSDQRDIPGSIHREESTFATWGQTLDCARPVIISCQRGLKVSQAISAQLRAKGWQASVLSGGFVGWRDNGLPLLDRKALIDLGWREGIPWVTRLRPKIDRVACPWLIKRFIDPNAVFLYVEPDQVQAVAARTGGIAYDVPDVRISHVGEDCSFDTLQKIAGLSGWPPLDLIARIVRGADNARLDLVPEAAGLLAISLGLSELAQANDHAMVQQAFTVYDGLYAWAARARLETHNWPPKA